MDLSSPVADAVVLFIQEIGAVLFGLVFLFLYRQSRIVYFGLWAAAWVLRFLAAIFGYELLRSGFWGYLAPYAVFEFAFAIVLIAGARAGFSSGIRDWRTVLRLIAILPVFVALVYAFGWFSRLEAYYASDAVVLCSVYLYNFRMLRKHTGTGARVFRCSLAVLAAVFLQHAVMLLYLYHTGAAPVWARYLRNETYFEVALHCVLAFAAFAMWSESQIDRIRVLTTELDHLRREAKHSMDLDRLTGLFNQSALAVRMEVSAAFQGVVAVCDMDNFKEINDCYGHLVGDEILRNIGHLLQASIRQEDEAFRWGGDEFVILFKNQKPGVAAKRMADIETRLSDFRVRGFGTLPISFSWGTAEAQGRPLREALDEADRAMYTHKRSRPPKAASNQQSAASS
jgi:diguanylate cyclase (GGDEF)-like protein